MCELSLEKRESILPRDEEEWLKLRTKDVTSTEVSALFGDNPFISYAQLYFAKQSGEVPEFEMNERMTWGLRLQNAIATGIGQDQAWKITPYPNYVRLRDCRMGSSFDFIAETPEGDCLLEIKCVDGLQFKDHWQETSFGLECPPRIELQVAHQLHVSGMKVAYVGCLINGNRVVLLRREYDPDVGRALELAVKKFWRQVDSHQPPEFDFSRDSDLITAIYASPTVGKTILADDRIEKVMAAYSAAAERARDADEEKSARRAELLSLVTDAERVIGQNYSASLGMVNRKEHVVAASSYRNIRVTKRKEKAA